MTDNNKNLESIVASPAKEKEKAQGKTVAEIELEIKTLELEEKKLALEFQKANLIDMRERLDERELNRQKNKEKSRINGATIKTINANEHAAQERCNHRKGGNGLNAYVGGQGQDPFYAMMKHTFCNGDVCIRCMRCGKTWKPPVRAHYKSEEAYEAAKTLYRIALEYPTNNTGSGSAQFRFSDNGEYYREMTANSTLR